MDTGLLAYCAVISKSEVGPSVSSFSGLRSPKFRYLNPLHDRLQRLSERLTNPGPGLEHANPSKVSLTDGELRFASFTQSKSSRLVISAQVLSLCISISWMEAKFFRFLKIVGVGYKARAEAAGRLLYLKLGYSHEVEMTVPPAVRVFCFKNNVVCCTGIDKQRVHQFAASVRSCKPPEVYKGKGIMYIDEVIKKKQGKKSK